MPTSTDLLGQKHVLARELLEHRRILSKVGGKDIGRVSGDPLRQIDGLVMAVVEDDEDARLLLADVLNRVTEALRDVADIALAAASLRASVPASRTASH